MKLRRHRIILALLLVVAVILGTACKAATLGSTPVECSSLHPGNAKATFNWTPGAGGVVQYLDLSLSDNGFAPGTFVSVGPLPGDAATFVWDGLLPGAVHVFRVNTFDGSQWWPSTTGYFTTLPCYSTAPLPTGGVIGSVLVADDGQYLGLISCNGYDADSIFNSFGTYGSPFSSRSIWNEFGRYGGEFGRYSPFNRFTSTPPYIFANGRFVAYLTQDGLQSPKVTPVDLIVACGAEEYFEYLP
jgi:hypothetical protein